MAESILQTNILDGTHKIKSPFDIKQFILPIVDLARLYSLKNQITTTNTVKRLNNLFDKNIISHTSYTNLLRVYNFLMQLRFKHQAVQITQH